MLNLNDCGRDNRVVIHENYDRCQFDLRIEGDSNDIQFSAPHHVEPSNQFQIAVFGSRNVIRVGAIFAHALTIHCHSLFHCSIGNGTRIQKLFISSNEAASVDIGEDCLIASDVKIYPTDFHPIFADGERINPPAPVRIGRHVWICENVMVLKGTTIEDGAVIGAGSIVARNVPRRALVAGNPARILRLGVDWSE